MDVRRALDAARRYCVAAGYDSDIIGSLYKQVISGKLYIAYFPDTAPNGLSNDLETRAIPALVVDSALRVSETDCTKKVLAREMEK